MLAYGEPQFVTTERMPRLKVLCFTAGSKKKGAYAALRVCQRYQVKMAILKAESPSCGNQQIYDGSFTGNKKKGMGVTAALLQQHQIRVFNETELLEASYWLKYLTAQEPALGSSG